MKHHEPSYVCEFKWSICSFNSTLGAKLMLQTAVQIVKAGLSYYRHIFNNPDYMRGSNFPQKCECDVRYTDHVRVGV